MKLGVAAAAIVIATVIAWWMWPRDEAPGSSRAVATASGSSSSSSTSPSPPRHVTRIAPDERQRIADRITAAQRERHATPPGPRPSLPPLPDTDHDLDRVDASLKDAMAEAIPILAECYEKTGRTGSGRAGVLMALTGDPSVGTLIDADQLTDEDGKPLDPALDTCLRDTFRSLELPPLHEGDQLHIKYTFKFGDDDKK